MSRREWRRPKGFQPSYTDDDTRRYVSRRSRLVRGLSISPDGRQRSGSGWIFWFLSNRGPAKFGGRHRVDVVRVEEGGGGGVPEEMTDYEPPDPGRWFYAVATIMMRKTGRYQFPNVPRELTFTDRDYADGFEFPFSFIRGEPFYIEYAISPGLQVSYSQVKDADASADSPFNPIFDYTYTSDRYPVSISVPPGRTVRMALNGSGLSREFELGVYNGGTRESFDFVNASAIGGGDLLDFRWFPGTPAFEISITDFYFLDAGVYDPDPKYPPGLGSGGGVPDGYLAPGDWAYRCSCPDFSNEEHPHQFVFHPSQRGYRSWDQIKPLQPCKHMVSAAVKLADEKAVGDWSRAAGADLFPEDNPLTMADLKRMDKILNGPQRRTPNAPPPGPPDANKDLPRPTRYRLLQDMKAHNQRMQEELAAYMRSQFPYPPQGAVEFNRYLAIEDAYRRGQTYYDTSGSEWNQIQSFYERNRYKYQEFVGPLDLRQPPRQVRSGPTDIRNSQSPNARPDGPYNASIPEPPYTQRDSY